MSEELAGGRLILDHPAEAVARLTIKNPNKRNALDHEILDAIADSCSHLGDGLENRCLVITGCEGTFSSGYNIGDIPTDKFAQTAERLVAHPFHRAIEAVEAFPYPTIASINGHALGGGLELALSCDLRVAATGVKLGMPPARLGLIYSHTGLKKFIDTIGVAYTKELFFSGSNLESQRAYEIGLVNHITGGEKLEAMTMELACRLVENAPLSLKGNKRIIDRLTSSHPLSEQDEQALIELRRSCFESEDFREGVKAFAEKRKPAWKGR